jgi:predicted nuclease of predicted toxin-antitoxin system
MGVAWRIVDWLRAAGHDVRHLREEGLHRLPDGDILAKAATERRVVLTFDLDFGDILALSEQRVVSVVLFRLHRFHGETATAFGHCIGDRDSLEVGFRLRRQEHPG